LGRDYFRQLTERPGVYLMRDAQDAVLYVGKAKNLRKRLGSYRVANPDRMARRHLRLLRAVERIELQECLDETAALAREAELLRSLKPKFNRAGTWPGKPRFLAWRNVGTTLELTVTETPETGWQAFGPMGSNAIFLRVALARLMWFARYSELGVVGMPVGWAKGILENPAVIRCGDAVEKILEKTNGVFDGKAAGFCDWIRERINDKSHPFDRAAVEADLEFVTDYFSGR
jgi:predicted GIY-YIG superfamily endonuclease